MIALITHYIFNQLFTVQSIYVHKFSCLFHYYCRYRQIVGSTLPQPVRFANLISIIIVEDQLILLDSLAKALSSVPEFEVVEQLTSATKVLQACDKYRPDIVLMDICTEDGASGITATAELKKHHPEIKVILMTAMPDISFKEDAQTAGADSFIYKNISSKELVSIINSTYHDYTVFPEQVEMPLLGYNHLTKREVEVLRMICAGATRKEIADSYKLSENTIKSNITSILNKTGYTSISRLALYVVSSGFIVTNNEAETNGSQDYQ